MVIENRKRYITYTIKDMNKDIWENKRNFRTLDFLSQYCSVPLKITFWAYNLIHSNQRKFRKPGIYFE